MCIMQHRLLQWEDITQIGMAMRQAHNRCALHICPLHSAHELWLVAAKAGMLANK